MKDLFLPYNLALLAKEKGFDEKVFAVVYPDEQLVEQLFNNLKLSPKEEYCVPAPLYQQIIDWFLAKHDIFIEVLVFDRGWLEDKKFCFQWRIYNKSEEWFTNLVEYKTPTEAYNTAIEEAFKLIP